MLNLSGRLHGAAGADEAEADASDAVVHPFDSDDDDLSRGPFDALKDAGRGANVAADRVANVVADLDPFARNRRNVVDWHSCSWVERLQSAAADLDLDYCNP